MEPPLCLFVEVPVCAFRPFASREYQDTYPVPPPSAIYGMLLSLVGVTRRQRDRHRGVSMALAVESTPLRSRIFRKLRRDEGKEGEPKFRPDYQDIMIDLRLWVWLAKGRDQSTPDLRTRVAEAIATPSAIERFGGLSLGESSYLVDSISTGKVPPPELNFIQPDPSGFHYLTTWVDHSDDSRTQLERFTIKPMSVSNAIDHCWISIGA
jgi:CRISPR-associated protein Cas5t